MTGRPGTTLKVSVDEPLSAAFAEAAKREHLTSSDLLRRLIVDFVGDSRRREAERQSALVASAADAGETMDLVKEVQGFARD